MWNFLKKLLVFRMGQTAAKSTARMLGFGKLGLLIGLIGGFRAMRANHRHHRHA